MAKPFSNHGVVADARLMQLTTRLPHRRRTARPHPRTSRPKPEPQETRDAARGGGPQDRAFYGCACGYAFTAAVTTSVDCPHCGSAQAW
jgi:hypothetical protein